MNPENIQLIRQKVIRDVQELKRRIEAIEDSQRKQRKVTSNASVVTTEESLSCRVITPTTGNDDVILIDSDDDELCDRKPGHDDRGKEAKPGWDDFEMVEDNTKLAQELADFEYATQLEREEMQKAAGNTTPSSSSSSGPSSSKASSSRTLNLVDPTWEVVDPNPDIRSLFVEFNTRYFGGKLAACEVRWSKRMTLCAGTCAYSRQSGYCVITLSEPLLKFRTRKELLETLVHELIHAELFVTARNDDHSAHGEAFVSRMRELNRLTGLNVTIYHTFHDEVNYYRNHIWRCDGNCRTRPPYFGFVRRATNRAPSRNDFWFPEHERSCGGTFHKVSEPDGYNAGGRRGRKKQQQSQVKEDTAATSSNETCRRPSNILNYFPVMKPKK